MNHKNLYSILILVLFICTGNVYAIPDPGVPDTVKLEGGPLVVGQSIPLSFTIVNDEELGAYSLGFILGLGAGEGYAVLDSAVYVGRMADPTVMSYRIENWWDSNPGFPDSILLGAQSYVEKRLPVGSDQLIELYFTGVTSGMITVDTGFFPPAGNFILVDQYGNTFDPQAVYPSIEVIDGNPPPSLSILSTTPRVVAGATVEFDVAAESPVGFPVTMDIVSLTGYDDETVLPDNDPTFGSGNPAEFSWTTTSADIGIWLATFEVCDSSGTCITADIDIQVLGNSTQLLPFDLSQTTGVCRVSTLQHGNFDNDAYLEIAASGSGEIINGPTLALYDFVPDATLAEVYGPISTFPKFGLQVGYFDSDANLDVIVMGYTYIGNWDRYRAITFLGDGDNGFSATDTSSAGDRGRGTTLDEFTGDSHLDYVSIELNLVRIYAGDGLGGFEPAGSLDIGQTVLSVNSGDFNDDGYTDLAVGIEAGVLIYLANGLGGFTSSYSYSQTYGSLDIEVTNQGSDFNNDNIFDLCISTPSVGGQYSDMVVYLGAGDGSFTQNVIRTVRGQIFGNCVGDFDGDGELDIAYVNGAREYAAILFGDGDGSFTNEIRYSIPHDNPQYIDCFDIDLDGDPDLVVAANGSKGYNSFFLLLNRLDPAEYTQMSFNISACDNAAIELTSENGKVFNRIKNSMPSGDYFKRNINENSALDDYAEIGVVESGEYLLKASPKPNLPAGENFTLEYNLDGELYRLAENVPMTSEGYNFGLSVTGDGVLPRSGAFIEANPPSFLWLGDGQFDFQLASDIDFTSLIYDETIDGNVFEVPSALEAVETELYYWRVKPHGTPDYDCLYAVNLIPGSSSDGDTNGDGLVNVADAVFLINFIFKGGPAPDPLEPADINCDGLVNVGDAVYLIKYIFGGGAPPRDGC